MSDKIVKTDGDVGIASAFTRELQSAIDETVEDETALAVRVEAELAGAGGQVTIKGGTGGADVREFERNDNAAIAANYEVMKREIVNQWGVVGFEGNVFLFTKDIDRAIARAQEFKVHPATEIMVDKCGCVWALQTRQYGDIVLRACNTHPIREYIT